MKFPLEFQLAAGTQPAPEPQPREDGEGLVPGQDAGNAPHPAGNEPALPPARGAPGPLTAPLLLPRTINNNNMKSCWFGWLPLWLSRNAFCCVRV